MYHTVGSNRSSSKWQHCPIHPPNIPMNIAVQQLPVLARFSSAKSNF